jgi:hypothetical protein
LIECGRAAVWLFQTEVISIRMRLRENHGRYPAQRRALPLPGAKVIARQEISWYHRYTFSSDGHRLLRLVV